MWKKCLLFLIIATVSIGCSSSKGEDVDQTIQDYPKSPSYTVEEILYPQSSGKKVEDSAIANIDYSHAEEGYICVQRHESIEGKIKIQIMKEKQQYNYDLNDTSMTAFPLQMGSGTYLVKILQHVEADQYALVSSISFSVDIKQETTPYLYPNQLVWYEAGDSITTYALEVVQNDENDLERIRDIYTAVAKGITYDEDKAVQASQKYILPNLKELLNVKKGICFDYASMMVAMLRINHIPARLICGNTDVEYHAWVEVYVEGKGWVNPDIFVAEDTWTRLDPTFASQKFQYDGDYEAIYYY